MAALATKVASKKDLSPTGFSRSVLGHSPWRLQAEIMESVANNRRTAVKSCHASGKTYTSADVVLWWITRFEDAIAVTTAPTNTQVEQLLWGEIRNSARGSHVKYPKILTKELKISEKNYAIGLSTNEAERFQGFHSGRVLLVLDEAPGVRNEIWQAAQGLMAGGDVRILAIGNPTIIGGPFHAAFTSSRELWKTYTISAFDTPNLQRVSLMFKDESGANVVVGSGKDLLELSEEELDYSTRPYLCTRRWVKEMFTEWGPNHPYFQSKVLGEFPTESDDSLIPLKWLERNRIRDANTPPSSDHLKQLYAGVDVAGPGEAETVLVVRGGPRVVYIKGWTHSDPRGELVAALGQFKPNLVRINVDSVGIGWNMYTHLKDQFGKIVFPINVGNRPRDKEKFVNAKAEFYWGLRLRVQAGDLRGLDDERTIGQLVAIRYKHNARGHIEIESKEDMRDRGVKSPDRAEALMLAFIERTTGEFGKLFFSTQ
jgi:phage terminase large subunit